MKYILILLILTSCFSKATLEELQGPDIDNNGVRDDIDEFIDSIDDRNDEYKQALRDYAYFGRESFKYDDNKEKSNKNSYHMLWTQQCISLLGREIFAPLMPKIQEYHQVNDAARKKLEEERKNVKETPSKEDDIKQDQNATLTLRAINEKYKIVLEKKSNHSNKEKKIFNKIHSLLTDNNSRKSSFHKHDMFFSGKMVWGSKDKMKVCGIRRRDSI